VTDEEREKIRDSVDKFDDFTLLGFYKYIYNIMEGKNDETPGGPEDIREALKMLLGGYE